jgi:hypothetical protein
MYWMLRVGGGERRRSPMFRMVALVIEVTKNWGEKFHGSLA